MSESPSETAYEPRYAYVERVGAEIGGNVKLIWRRMDLMLEDALPAAREAAARRAGDSPLLRRSIAFWVTVSLFVLLLVLAIVGSSVMAEDDVDAELSWTTAWTLTFLGALASAFITSWLMKNARVEHADQIDSLTKDILMAVVHKVDERKKQARDYAPSGDPVAETSLRSAGPAPDPQPYGVSHQGAELLVAQWMRYFGEGDAEVTQFTGDGGIDVQSNHYIVQVKNYAGTVGVAAVRELAGVAHTDGRKALFFTSGVYASGAVEFADRAAIALFVYDAVQGTLVPENELASAIMQRGL